MYEHEAGDTIELTIIDGSLRTVADAIEARWPGADVSVSYGDLYYCDTAGFGTPWDRVDVEVEAERIARSLA